ncbi:M50 family metallopeptidase [Oenococcus kitaharae]|uniref:Membrane-associated zinc metalloprotease n=1 Tax=Oenococcus kitaharae DSM 17330 TaxID=1045004 RepID=G9WH61_9LACO|nr:M50 family metallopeptidase [Oenococcus kitaharae]EHN59550.1 Membrane-associated zinc metalloprotease [Oenococcus kitaharae DSM 17330]OEY83403.1 peptidase [Oenococcus kitaharae]OEY85202.1 peptidase [Oenococcus kitaharae]OEY86056.1 peptidase [Oenococcus kitaharae]
MNLTAIVAFILVFGLIVTVHEFGHFFAAKKFGVVVYEFSIGMGPKIFGKNWHGTNYVIRILPVGGYVLMAGGDQQNEYLEDLRPGKLVKLKFADEKKQVVNQIDISDSPADSDTQLMRIKELDTNQTFIISGTINEDQNVDVSYRLAENTQIKISEDRQFELAPKNRQLPNIAIWKQAIVNFAGPLMNFLLAFVLFIGLSAALPRVPLSNSQIDPMPGYPAARQGLKKGDVITRINTRSVHSWNQLTQAVTSVGDRPIKVTFKRGSQQRTISIQPRKAVESGQTRYLIGVEQDTGTGLNQRVNYAFSSFYQGATMIGSAFLHLITHPSLDQLGGPVAIAQTTSSAAAAGFLSVVSLTAFLSLNIGIFNLIPIPVLDGGKLLLNLIQAIRRKPLSEKTNQVVMISGVVFIILLMIAVTINDLLR